MVEYKIDWGSVELGHSMGWFQQEDGGWYEKYSPTRYLDQNGVCTKTVEREPYIIMYCPDWDPRAMDFTEEYKRKSRPWWRKLFGG